MIACVCFTVCMCLWRVVGKHCFFSIQDKKREGGDVSLCVCVRTHSATGDSGFINAPWSSRLVSGSSSGLVACQASSPISRLSPFKWYVGKAMDCRKAKKPSASQFVVDMNLSTALL